MNLAAQNLLLDGNGDIKIAEFGVAHTLDPDQTQVCMIAIGLQTTAPCCVPRSPVAATAHYFRTLCCPFHG